MSSYIVTGLAFGDEGKGSWVDHLCRLHNIKTVARFNGGAQALHHVTTPEGVTHGFSQFGSHTFLPGAKTLLSRFMLIEPLTLLEEAKELRRKGVRAPLRTLFVSEQAPIIPYSNVLLNRAMEAYRGAGRHGSCGLGIGLTQQDVEELGVGSLRAGDLVLPQEQLREKLFFLHQRALTAVEAWSSEGSAPFVTELRHFSIDEYAEFLLGFAKQVRIIPEAAFLSIIARERVVFEGAQGALLDQYQGFFPHCTRSTTTTANAEELLKDAGQQGEVFRYGLLRGYGTRHGAGPFPTEAGVAVTACDNVTGQWQGEFRQGWFDAVLARTALQFALVDGVVLTNLDRLDGSTSVSVASEYRDLDTRFYDRSGGYLNDVSNYEESTERTEALFQATPVYETLPGWSNGKDLVMEGYVQTIEDLIGTSVTALSRRKDHFKIYR